MVSEALLSEEEAHIDIAMTLPNTRLFPRVLENPGFVQRCIVFLLVDPFMYHWGLSGLPLQGVWWACRHILYAELKSFDTFLGLNE